MNNPFRPLADEVRRIAAAGFDFVDLTLEPPGSWPAVVEEVRSLLGETGLDVVGHTAWYLPIASPFPELRAAARGLTLMVENIGRSFGTAAELAPLLDADSRVRFHLDVGHAHLAGGTTNELLAAFG